MDSIRAKYSGRPRTPPLPLPPHLGSLIRLPHSAHLPPPPPTSPPPLTPPLSAHLSQLPALQQTTAPAVLCSAALARSGRVGEGTLEAFGGRGVGFLFYARSVLLRRRW